MYNLTISNVYDPMLDAVNACLSGIGQASTDTLDDGSADTDMAVNVINRVSRQMQSQGWWFNKEANWVLKPEPFAGRIPTPVNALSVVNEKHNRYRQLAIRGGFLYDVDQHTYDLTSMADASGNLTLTFIVLLDFGIPHLSSRLPCLRLPSVPLHKTLKLTPTVGASRRKTRTVQSHCWHEKRAVTLVVTISPSPQPWAS